MRPVCEAVRELRVTRVVLDTVTDPPATVALHRLTGYEEIRIRPSVGSQISSCMGKNFEPPW